MLMLLLNYRMNRGDNQNECQISFELHSLLIFFYSGAYS